MQLLLKQLVQQTPPGAPLPPGKFSSMKPLPLETYHESFITVATVLCTPATVTDIVPYTGNQEQHHLLPGDVN